MNYLFILFFLILIFMILLTTRFKLPIFPVMLFSTFLFGLLGGLDPQKVISASLEGFKSMMGGLALIIVFGVALGEFLEKSGGTLIIARAVLRLLGKKRAAWAMAITGSIISVPVMCCDTAFIILSPLARALAQGGGVPLAFMSMALASGTYSAFKLIPPSPGPMGVITAFQADFLKTFLLSFLIFIPVMLIGLWWSFRLRKNGSRQADPESDVPSEIKSSSPNRSVWLAALPIAVPLILIILHSLASQIFPSNLTARSWFLFIGNPSVALPIGVISLSMIQRKVGIQELNGWFSTAIKRAAPILLIVGAGGALGKIVQETGLADALGNFLVHSQIPGIFVPFFLAALLKITQGSSLVAMFTTPALVAPLLPSMHLAPEIAVLAVGAGALAVVHVNDSFFWVVTRFSEMDVHQGLRSITLMSLWQSLAAFLIVWLLSLFF